MSKKPNKQPKFMKRDVLDQFDNWKSAERFKLEAAVKQSERIDTWVSLREDFRNFVGRIPTFDEVQDLFHFEVHEVSKLYKRLEELKYTDLLDEDFTDWYDGYIMAAKVAEEDPSDLNMFKSFLKFSTVRPWAEHVMQFREFFLEEWNKLKEEEPEENNGED